MIIVDHTALPLICVRCFISNHNNEQEEKKFSNLFVWLIHNCIFLFQSAQFVWRTYLFIFNFFHFAFCLFVYSRYKIFVCVCVFFLHYNKIDSSSAIQFVVQCVCVCVCVIIDHWSLRLFLMLSEHCTKKTCAFDFISLKFQQNNGYSTLLLLLYILIPSF